MLLNPDLLPLLACPACRQPLRPVDNEAGLACEACAAVFPVDRGIALLVMEEAVSRTAWENGERRSPNSQASCDA